MDKLDNVAKFLDKNFSKEQSGDMIKKPDQQDGEFHLKFKREGSKFS